MSSFVPFVAAAFALAGTSLQALDTLRRLNERDPEGANSFKTVDGLKTSTR